MHFGFLWIYFTISSVSIVYFEYVNVCCAVTGLLDWFCLCYPPNIYLFKGNNWNTRKMRETRPKLTMKTLVNDVALMFLLLIIVCFYCFYRIVIVFLLNFLFYTFSSVCIVDFEQVNISWVMLNTIWRNYMWIVVVLKRYFHFC